MTIDRRSRYSGALYGLACGDAVGTTVEFSPRGSFPPVTDMTGGGPFGLKPGQWTDDTSMALCLAESLLTKGSFDPKDQMGRYNNWWHWGYLSSTGVCFDIGMTVQSALAKFAVSGDPYSGSTDANAAGNGSLMRLAPVVLFAFPDEDKAILFAGESSRTTHGAPEAIESCQLLASILCGIISGRPKEHLLADTKFAPHEPKIRALQAGDFLKKEEREIRGNGYCVDSLEAALWCFFSTANFREAILRAVNLGEDADTTGAIVGQLAGSYYGVEDIPAAWIEKLSLREDIGAMSNSLYERFGADS